MRGGVHDRSWRFCRRCLVTSLHRERIEAVRDSICSRVGIWVLQRDFPAFFFGMRLLLVIDVFLQF